MQHLRYVIGGIDMAVSEMLKGIMQLLKHCGVTADGGIVILCLIKDAGIEEEVLDWMCELDEPPTENEILEMVCRMIGL